MARISRDGAHSEMTSDPKWREEQQAKEEKRKDTEAVKFAVETYHHSGAGPSAAELNKEAAKNSKITQRLGESEKNLTYTGKYLEAKGEMVSSTEQSFRDYQAELGLNEDYKRLDEMEAEFARNPSRQLAQEHDELLDAVIKKEQMLKVYEQAYLDTVESYNSLVQQGQDEWKTYQEVWENWDKNRRVFHYMMDDYQEDDWDQLSDEAKTAFQGYEDSQNETSQGTIDWIGEKLVSIDDEIEVTQKKYDEKLLYYRDYYHEHGEYPEGYQAAEAELDGYQEKINRLEADKKQYKQMQKNESNELDFRKQYGGLKYNSDFQQYAGYEPVEQSGLSWVSDVEDTYHKINSDPAAEGILDKWDTRKDHLKEMKQDEINIFNYIYQKSGEEEAQKYIDELTPILHKRQRESREKEITEFSQKGWGEAALSSIGSVLTKPLEGISYLGQGIDYLMDGEIDENAPYNAFVYENNAARNAVDKKIKETWGEAGSFMYQLGMGFLDFTYTMVLSHGLAAGAGALGAPIGSVAKAASNLSLAIMSTEAAAETVLDAKDRGLEDGDAFWLGTIAGATELLTEKVSIDTLLNGIGKGKSKLGYLLKNALTEGSEEMTSSAVNWLADVMISKDKSEWEEILFYYRAMGFSEDVAFMEALKEQGRQMLKDGAAGAITGAAAAGGRLAFGQISEGIQNHRNYRETVQNGRQYYALNQLSQGDLARSLGNMNVEQAYRTMSPEAIMETSGLKPRQAQYLLENTGYSPEGRANRPSVNQVYSMLRATGLNHQETQALMKSRGYPLDGISEKAKYAPELDFGPEQIVQKKAGEEFDLLENTVDTNLRYKMDLFPEGEVNQDSSFAREEEWSHRKGKGGDYGVTWSSIDQTDYEACFSQLTDNEKVSRAISTRAKWLLNTYDGRNTESLYVIDLNDGAEIERRDGGEGESGVERSKKFEAKLNAAESAGSQILLIHNHPKGLPPSVTDINALLRSERAVGIVVGHDGSVYYYTKPETEIPEKDFEVANRKYKRYTDKTAQEKALDEMAKRFHFTWEKLR